MVVGPSRRVAAVFEAFLLRANYEVRKEVRSARVCVLSSRRDAGRVPKNLPRGAGATEGLLIRDAGLELHTQNAIQTQHRISNLNVLEGRKPEGGSGIPYPPAESFLTSYLPPCGAAGSP